MTQLQEWLGKDRFADRVIVKPVIDLAGQRSVDCYETPSWLHEALTLRHPFEIFPYGTLRSRACDTDHTSPYLPPARGGPPGQTSLGNLGPLSRSHHRAKTLGGFSLRQPRPGLYLWRAPSGSWYQVDHTGTTALGTRTPDVIERQHSAWSPLETRFHQLIAERAA